MNIENNDISGNEYKLRWGKFDEAHWFPLQPATHVEDVPKLSEQFKMQKIRPHLALYDPTIQTDFLSHYNLCVILNSEDETALLKLLTDAGVTILYLNVPDFWKGPSFIITRKNKLP